MFHLKLSSFEDKRIDFLLLFLYLRIKERAGISEKVLDRLLMSCKVKKRGRGLGKGKELIHPTGLERSRFFLSQTLTPCPVILTP